MSLAAETTVPEVFVRFEGRRFAARVQVWSGERYLFHCHPERACKMLEDGQAEACSGKRIGRINLISFGYRPYRPSRPWSPAIYIAQRYVYRQYVGTDGPLWTWAFRRLELV